MNLKQRLGLPEPVLIGGAHDAISARLVEQAGFDAVWLSGLGVSVASKAIPDAGLITMSEMLQVGRNMAAAVTIPIVADCDDGYGGVDQVAYLVREYQRAGIEAVCIEDNEHPKKNSFYEVGRRLVPAREMAAKIEAGKRAQGSNGSLFIARTEAIIAGLGVEEALHRAHAYQEAGADALLVHSKVWRDVEEFLARWSGSIPLVSIPTMFPEVGVPRLRDAGFRAVIYANQPLRAAIWAMRDALAAIRQNGRFDEANARVVSLKEVEDLVHLQEWNGLAGRVDHRS